MDHYMPQIFWHDRKALLSVDIQQNPDSKKYKIVTSSVQKEIRIWSFEFEENLTMPVAPLSVTFLANLENHSTAINQVKFGPIRDVPLLASGDCQGRITIWQLKSDSPPPPPSDELPPNKENWTRTKHLNHDNDVNSLCWSPCGDMLASVSNDDCLCVHNVMTGRRLFTLRNFRHFPNGVSWDPQGKYLVTMSADRKMDLFDAVKGTKLRAFGVAELPEVIVCPAGGEKMLEKKLYKLFHDDQLYSFQRGVAFSPNGDFIAAPCAHLELGSYDLYGTYIFRREDLGKDAPSAFYPSPKPTFLVKFSPVVMKLRKGTRNFLGYPYRIQWAAFTKDSVNIYDSQHEHPIGVIDNIHYNSLTDATWSADGRVLVVSSLEGYCSFIKFKQGVWGEEFDREHMKCPASPGLIEEKKRKKKEKAVPATPTEADQQKSPLHEKQSTPVAAAVTKTPVSLKKFFQVEKGSSTTNTTKTENSDASPITARPKKRIQIVTLGD